MIFPMKKISLLLYHREKESFLKALQNLGVIQIEIKPEKEAEGLLPVMITTKKVNRTLQKLSRIKKTRQQEPIQVSDGNAKDIILQFEEAEQAIEIATQRISRLEKNLETLTPWGNFDPAAVKKLHDAGISVRFFEAPMKKYNKQGRMSTTYLELI